MSLLPSATETLFAIGAGDDVVGVTFECDFPPEARERRIVSTSTLPEGLTPAGIDAAVSAALAAGEDLYRLDAGALAGLDASLVVTQDLCAVCAVDVREVDAALAHLGCRADVLTLDPHTLDEVLASVTRLGAVTGRSRAAEALCAGLEARLAAVRDRVSGLRPVPTLVLEWTDPPFAPGHWVPEMVERAGGSSVLGAAGARSERTDWASVAAAGAEVVISAPCGFALPESVRLAEELVASGRLPAGVPVWAMDANASFARPGPRLVDGIEALAAVLHPGSGPDPDPEVAARVR